VYGTDFEIENIRQNTSIG